MAGQPGKSGGARPGAGRKPKEPAILKLAATYDDPEKFLRAVMNDSGSEAKLRVDAAKALMPFTHQKLGEGGKKERQADAAKKVAGRFSASVPPKLVAAGGKKI
jgi:phage terminase small subunit